MANLNIRKIEEKTASLLSEAFYSRFDNYGDFATEVRKTVAAINVYITNLADKRVYGKNRKRVTNRYLRAVACKTDLLYWLNGY